VVDNAPFGPSESSPLKWFLYHSHFLEIVRSILFEVTPLTPDFLLDCRLSARQADRFFGIPTHSARLYPAFPPPIEDTFAGYLFLKFSPLPLMSEIPRLDPPSAGSRLTILTSPVRESPPSWTNKRSRPLLRLFVYSKLRNTVEVVTCALFLFSPILF